MKLFLIVLFLTLTSCAQLMNGQSQPVRTLGKNTYLASCGGAVETWSDCNRSAMKECNGNYLVVSKNENSVGTVRELTFQCNK